MSEIERAALIAWRGLLAAAWASGLPEARQRPAALYLLVTLCNVPGALAARVAGCSKQNVSKLLARVEDEREDAGFDRALAALERRLKG